jgi:N-ethylmaleimide reductase
VDKLQKLQDFIVPKEMILQDTIHAKTEFVCAAEMNFIPGFDDVTRIRQTDILV